MDPITIIAAISTGLTLLERIFAFRRTKKKVRVLTEGIELARQVIRRHSPVQGKDVDARLVSQLEQAQRAAGVKESIARAVKKIPVERCQQLARVAELIK